MEYNHKVTGWKISVADLTQGMAEEFDRHFKNDEPGGSSSQDAGRVVRAAIKAGWLSDITVEHVFAMQPAQVRWIAGKLDELYTEAITIPPE